MTEVQATIQALATVESLTNDIDTLAVLDRQVKVSRLPNAKSSKTTLPTNMVKASTAVKNTVCV
jgi:hypothetical protein